MNHKSTVTLETERLVLRRLEMNDAEAMFRNWANDPEVTKYMPYNTCETLEQTQVIITEWLDSIDGIETNSRDIFAIILKSTAEPIGTIDYTETDHAVKSAEIGYQLGKRWWHNGYAAEALIALIKYCFQECGLKRLWAMYNANNPNSGAVMRKAGMIYEGTFRKDRLRKGVRRDSIQYAILAEDYFNTSHKEQEMAKLNIATIKNLTELMYHNLRIAMDTVDWSADICGAPAWRYIYHTLHSAICMRTSAS